jgi:hypothetical protein
MVVVVMVVIGARVKKAVFKAHRGKASTQGIAAS